MINDLFYYVYNNKNKGHNTFIESNNWEEKKNEINKKKSVQQDQTAL